MEDPKTMKQLVRLLAKTLIFADTTQSFRTAVAERLLPVEYHTGQVVFRHGEPGDWLGILVEGSLSRKLQRVSTEIPLGGVSPGGIVGDLGLFGVNPKRSFTVTADVPSVLLVLSAEHFEECVRTAGGPKSLALFRDSGEMRNLMADVESFVNLQCFRRLDRDFVLTLRENSEPRLCYPNQVLMTEGQFGDEMYILRAGSVKIEKDGKFVVELPGGTVLGELAVLGSDKRRTATVTCTSLCLMRVLHADVFHEILDAFPCAKRTFDHSFIARLVCVEVDAAKSEKVDMDTFYGSAMPRTKAEIASVLGTDHVTADDLRRSALLSRKAPKPFLPKLHVKNGVVQKHTPRDCRTA